MATVRVTLTALVVYLIVPLALTLSLKSFSFSKELFINSFLVFAVLLMLAKVSFLSLRKSKRKFWMEHKNIVIVGAGKGGLELYKHFNENPQLGYKVVGVFGDPANNKSLDKNFKILGSISDCLEYSLSNNVSEIFCALPGNELDRVRGLITEADKNMIRLRLVPDLKELFNENVNIELYGDMPILSARYEPLELKTNEVVKRVFDIGFSFLVISFVLSWAIPLIALILKLESPGPIFIKHLRSGKNNKPFYCYKFRTTCMNFEANNLQVNKFNAEVTSVGAVLRKTGFDELPQFFNVLIGEMSVVGPRPAKFMNSKGYSYLIGNFMVRHILTPGMTGWAQVSLYKSKNKKKKNLSNSVEADLWYLENWSIFLDLKIILRSVWKSIRINPNAFKYPHKFFDL